MSQKPLTVDKLRPICTRCHNYLCKTNGRSKMGFRKYSKYCSSCHSIVYNLNRGGKRRLGYQKYKKEICENCEFKPVHSCQLDVDHIDGDYKNNDINNLQTLCANCHRLKTHEQRKARI